MKTSAARESRRELKEIRFQSLFDSLFYLILFVVFSSSELIEIVSSHFFPLLLLEAKEDDDDEEVRSSHSFHLVCYTYRSLCSLADSSVCFHISFVLLASALCIGELLNIVMICFVSSPLLRFFFGWEFRV